MSAKLEFVKLATRPGVNMRELCRRFGISPTTGYKLLARYESEGEAGLTSRSRRPRRSPTRTSAKIEQSVLSVCDETHWGARKISKDLERQKIAEIPRSTVHQILKRNGRVGFSGHSHQGPWLRFEHPEPNDLWQIDFMGSLEMKRDRCHPFTAIDDHSRFNIALDACADQTTETVQQSLTQAFRRYGLPWRITMDNGSPWGDDAVARLTKITAWMLRLGIRVTHSRPYHPQTQGKDERLHRSLRHELVRWTTFRDLVEAQREFDRWRDRYNFRRPHEALDMAPPISRYRPSNRAFPETLPPIEYGSDEIRKVDPNGKIRFKGRVIRVGKGCARLPVAIRPQDDADGQYEVFFCHQVIATIDLRDPQTDA